ncbi:MAG: ABC transporter ATP-binding protein [Epsilonproteobacteria bacterium]|nr:ABC transporter ATP-binding protein [Campylobacterota bacterium]
MKKDNKVDIEAKKLTLAYDKGRKIVIENATFKINRGDFVFITGPSGSGKSTLLKSFYGQIKPFKGELKVGGYDMNKIKRRDLLLLRQKLGIVFQDYKLINEWTVEKNVILPLIIAGYNLDIQKVQAKKLLAHVRLSEYADKYPLELSGGEQQRVGVARALSKNPFLILADEPTGNLDEFSSGVVWDLLENVCTQFNTTVVVVTHRIPQIFNINYRHFIIENGGIHEIH